MPCRSARVSASLVSKGGARSCGTASYSLRSPNPVPGFGPAGDDRIARPSSHSVCNAALFECADPVPIQVSRQSAGSAFAKLPPAFCRRATLHTGSSVRWTTLPASP